MAFSSADRADLLALLGPERAFFEVETRALYETDETPRACLPEAVLFPGRPRGCGGHRPPRQSPRLPLVARGAGSGNLGGALPVPGGVVVSFECMNRVLEFDPANRLWWCSPAWSPTTSTPWPPAPA
jgi:D-lactate dehydrogenase